MPSFIETYLSKPAQAILPIDVESFVARKVPENLSLEYKSVELFGKPDDISVVISSLANATGGLFFLGVSEDSKTHLPKQVEWSDPAKYPKETLENLLVPRLHPRVDGLTIHPISNPAGLVTYLIEVPPGSNPPYMAGDKRYYKRLNFRKVPMEGYEVADLFGRRRRPILGLVPTVEAAGAVYNLTFHITNFGKAPATDVYIVLQATGCEIKGFEGKWTRDSPQVLLFYNAAPDSQPIYQHPTRKTKIGRLSFIPTAPTRDLVRFSYEISTQDGPPIQGSFIVSPTSIPPAAGAAVIETVERPLDW
jgi:hypothetical protein